MRKTLQRGFSIIELILYFGGLSILLTVLTFVFANTLDAQLETQATSAVDHDGEYILARMMYDINQVQSWENIATPSARGQQTAALRFRNGATTYEYALDGNNNILLSNVTAGTTNQLNGYNTAISNLTFQWIGNVTVINKPTMKIHFRVTSRTEKNSGFETRDFDTTIGVR